MKKVVKTAFFNRRAVMVAQELLGKFLVRKINNKITKYKIVETEAYEGWNDKASHASRGRTARNAPMFGKPGTIYVYFTYGVHWMLNIVCGKRGYPAAVLIRGVEGCVGPGRLTKKLNINKSLNGKMLGRASRLWFEDWGNRTDKTNKTNKKFKIIRTPRIGVKYAGPVWSKKLYRFLFSYSYE